MSLLKYVTSLLPTFGKDRLIEDLEIVKGELASLQAAYTAAASELRGYHWKTDEVKELALVFKRNVSGSDAGNFVVHIDKNLRHVVSAAEKLSGLTQKLLGNEVAGRGLTYKQTAVVQFEDALSFVNNYARKLLNYVYVMETAKLSDDGADKIRDALTPADQKYITEKMAEFAQVYAIIVDAEPKMEEKIESIPEIVVTQSKEETLGSTIGTSKISPFGFHGLNPGWNLILLVRLSVAEYQVRRYKQSKEELELLKLRLMQMKKVQAGRQDAALEKQISYMERRIQTQAIALAEMEKG